MIKTSKKVRPAQKSRCNPHNFGGSISIGAPQGGPVTTDQKPQQSTKKEKKGNPVLPKGPQHKKKGRCGGQMIHSMEEKAALGIGGTVKTYSKKKNCGTKRKIGAPFKRNHHRLGRHLLHSSRNWKRKKRWT